VRLDAAQTVAYTNDSMKDIALVAQRLEYGIEHILLFKQIILLT
jgi:hypothetical protein